MRFLFIMDELERIELGGDTTYAFLLEAGTRGHQCWSADALDLSIADGRVHARSRPTTAREATTVADAFELGDPEMVRLGEFDAVFMRKDPPLDDIYLQATWILEAARGETLLVNDPRALRELNEHLAILHFPDLIPPTLVSRDADQLRGFLRAQGGAVVVKPVDGHGGRGIFVLRAGDPNLSSLIETSTQHGQVWTMAQRYLPEAKDGDKRILLVDGVCIGAVNRVPAKDEARGNLHVGGRAEKTSLSAREQEIVDRVGPMLAEQGVLFAGIDVIGDSLTEINITSPTGIRHLDALEGGRSAGRLFDAVEQRVRG